MQCLYHCLKQPRDERFFSTLSIIGLCLFVSACTSVDTILLTSDTFPPKGSADEVAVLAQTPTRPHRQLAELRIGDSGSSFASLQRKILNRAAALGADAVVFAAPQTQTQHQVAYEQLYEPWDSNSPYYGLPWGYGSYGGPGIAGPYELWPLWGGGYPNSIGVPYDEVTRMLMGTAIRYTDAPSLRDPNVSGKARFHDSSAGRSDRRGVPITLFQHNESLATSPCIAPRNDRRRIS